MQLVATLLMMFVYSPRLALVFLATAPLYALMMYNSARYLRPLLDKLEDAYGRYQSHQIDAIRGIETVKAMAAESTFREVMLGQFNAVSRRRFKADFTMMTFDGVVQMVTFLSVALFLFVGARSVMDGAAHDRRARRVQLARRARERSDRRTAARRGTAGSRRSSCSIG